MKVCVPEKVICSPSLGVLFAKYTFFMILQHQYQAFAQLTLIYINIKGLTQLQCCHKTKTIIQVLQMIPFLPYSILGGIQKSSYDTLLLVRPFKTACARLPNFHLPTIHLLLAGSNCRHCCSALPGPVGHTAVQPITAMSLNTPPEQYNVTMGQSYMLTPHRHFQFWNAI